MFERRSLPDAIVATKSVNEAQEPCVPNRAKVAGGLYSALTRAAPIVHNVIATRQYLWGLYGFEMSAKGFLKNTNGFGELAALVQNSLTFVIEERAKNY